MQILLTVNIHQKDAAQFGALVCEVKITFLVHPQFESYLPNEYTIADTSNLKYHIKAFKLVFIGKLCLYLETYALNNSWTVAGTN